ncbi:hypothetical protein BLNAU_22414 [Blattamonas nauphoetae]|uniref:Uncharacterized protein n=1 Tax=Blattamonas nauphoetae TaxID=2049346 RepID=A0ABQ9WVD9_9EUKA|nr:hypothetical protein BLNAU_22414 [Blattamonas nauphoetae]
MVDRDSGNLVNPFMRVPNSEDEAFGYLKRVIVTPAVYPRLIEFLHFDIQSTEQKSQCVNTVFQPSHCFVLIKQSDSLVRSSSKLIVYTPLISSVDRDLQSETNSLRLKAIRENAQFCIQSKSLLFNIDTQSSTLTTRAATLKQTISTHQQTCCQARQQINTIHLNK